MFLRLGFIKSSSPYLLSDSCSSSVDWATAPETHWCRVWTPRMRTHFCSNGAAFWGTFMGLLWSFVLCFRMNGNFYLSFLSREREKKKERNHVPHNTRPIFPYDIWEHMRFYIGTPICSHGRISCRAYVMGHVFFLESVILCSFIYVIKLGTAGIVYIQLVKLVKQSLRRSVSCQSEFLMQVNWNKLD